MQQGHQPCPSCRSKGRDNSGNNLYVYPDGHGYCFACGYRNDAPLKEKIMSIEVGRVLYSNEIKLPKDASKVIPSLALDWLNKYEITQSEVIDHKMMWSDQMKWLIFPVYGDSFTEQLLGFQARNFSDKGNKYYTRGGYDSIVNYYGKRSNDGTIVLTEDVISAIKVARQHAAMPLLGSFLTVEKAKRLRNFFDHLTFWLDYDKIKSAIQQATRMKSQGFKTSIIVTHNDPKSYNNSEIKDILKEVK